MNRFLLIAVALLITGSQFAVADEWPTKPIRIVESFPAGVARDVRTRIVADRLSKVLGQQVFVDNRPGAAGRIAATAAASAAPDGTTFILMGTTETITRHLFSLPYDIERDFRPVSLIEDSLPVAAVARASLPAKSLSELIAFAKAHPGKLTYGSTGVGLFIHLNGLLFSQLAGIDLRHIPYTQGSPFTDLLGGHIDLIFDALPPTLENIKAGRLHALAISSKQRLAILPDVPTFTEAGLPGYDVFAFYGLLAPKGTPDSVTARMQAAIAQVVSDPALRGEWENQGGSPRSSSPSEFGRRIHSESERWGTLIRANKIKLEQ
jgi:tripartite-type tricarboxylate transporter receptor subunit TctC